MRGHSRLPAPAAPRRDDKTLGKITFRADATIGYGDALPADNELPSTPVKF
jgi:hypothetical protein